MSSHCSITDQEWALKHLRFRDEDDAAEWVGSLELFAKDVDRRLRGATDLPSVCVAREEAFLHVFGRRAWP